MTESAITAPSPVGEQTAWSQDAVLLVIAFAVGLVHRLTVGWDAPLWIDETYTGTIAAQSTAGDLMTWFHNELGGPLYYAFIFLWEKLAGPGNFALRAPSFLFSAAAPVLLLLWGHPDRRTRIYWAALAALWLPGLFQASQARPYALAFLLACGQATLFIRAADRAKLPALMAWSIISALCVLTHLHALIVTGFQGLALLVAHRRAWKALWPALLPFLAVAAWLPVPIALAIKVNNPEVAIYPLLTGSFFLKFSGVYLGTEIVSAVVMAVVVMTFAVQLWQKAKGSDFRYGRSETALALSGFTSVLLVTILGFILPTYCFRYIIPLAPAALLAVAMALRTASRWSPAVPITAISMLTIAAGAEAARFGVCDGSDAEYSHQIEDASTWLMQHDARRVTFVWDHPAASRNDPARLAEVGGFFFRRAGKPVVVAIAHFGHGPGASAALARAATAPHTGIMWLGGKSYPAHVADFGNVECRLFGIGTLNRSLACIRR